MRTLALAIALAVVAPGSGRAAPPGSPWGAAYFPDVPLVTQDGDTRRFYGDLVQDKHVVINFIFTRCKAACPLETANLVRVQKRLGARVGRDIFFYSITLDPEHDTPAALQAYARAFHAGPGWLFLTGRRADLELIRARLGDRSPWRNHAVGLSIGNDPAGQWTSLSAVDDPGFLASQISEWMTSTPAAHAPVKSYVEAPRVRSDTGADLFRTHCAACHSLGGGDGAGPDLAGVTRRRDPAWLARWLADPARLVHDEDPRALELVAKHGSISMPTFALTAREIAALVAYLDAPPNAATGQRRAITRAQPPPRAPP